MLIGIVCEGPTDWAVLDVLASGIVPGADCRPVHPNFDALRPQTGWQAVRKFLGPHGNAGRVLAIGVYDIIVIQVDASIRLKDDVPGKLRSPAVDEDELAPLCDHVKGWIDGGVPENVIIALPREDLEAWLLPVASNLTNVEGLSNPSDELASRGVPAKNSARYRELAVALARFASDPRKVAAVPELERFVGKLREKARRIRQAAKASSQP